MRSYNYPHSAPHNWRPLHYIPPAPGQPLSNPPDLSFDYRRLVRANRRHRSGDARTIRSASSAQVSPA
ncbi:hypothetical protein J4732_11575 [Serratia marcescens]|uniref:Uncharacterized protein n=1 Tax=Serratia marcescens TaxID=615 RepID=A0A939STH1_SERMA|nr:hypothetical protein [Serratia marcescens]